MAAEQLPVVAELGAPDFAHELDEALLVGKVAPERAERWSIDSIAAAEWAMRRRAALQRRHEEVVFQAQEWRATYDEWERDELERLRRSEEYFDQKLGEYALTRREEDERNNKTLVLPSGVVETRKGSEPSVHVGNEEAVIRWAFNTLSRDEYDKVVKTEKTVRVRELAKRVKIAHHDDGSFSVVDADGEHVPGCYVQSTGQTTAKVKPS